MIQLLAILAVLAAADTSAGVAAGPPLTELIPGVWRGVMTADGVTTHIIIAVRPDGQRFAGDGLLWFAMTEDEARQAQLGALPPKGTYPRAFAIEQQFAVTLDGRNLKFAGTRAEHLLLPIKYNPDTFAGELQRPGLVTGTARDAKGIGGMFHLWKEGALDTPLGSDLAKGKVHELGCLEGGRYHYSCYIPKSYDPSKPTPLLVNISPGGNGQPLSIDAAEDAGWLMAGLKEAKNGPMPPNLANLNAVLFDLRRRFNIHPRRTYFSGFSGGSRMASWAAINHQDACSGIICIGAGFYDGPPPKFHPIFFIVGRADFNLDEVTGLHRQAEHSIRKTNLIIHPGAHTWGRPQDHGAAIRWLNDLTKKKRSSRP